MEDNGKPITYITTYRGVRNFSKGLHEGINRDVMITGTEIPGPRDGGYSTVPAKLAAQAFDSSNHGLKYDLDRIDEMFVYLGLDGAGPGFEYVAGIMVRNGNKDITLVACDCGSEIKENFARETDLQIIWAECGGMKTLEKIVEQKLRE